jgi:antitoxin (DNA-binding transcriptional repressor) of toxin-antitoxin stability system
MKVNALEAKNQVSRLGKDALEGEEVVIAGTGEPWSGWCLSRRKAPGG